MRESESIPGNFNEDSAMLLNCELQHSCPRDWESLAESAQRGRRWCSECKREVQFCATEDEYQAAVERADCVAFMAPPNAPKRVMVGLPAGYSKRIGHILKDL